MALFYDPITDEAGPARTWEEDEEEFEELYGSSGQATYHLKLLSAAERLQEGGSLRADLLLVGASTASRALLSQLGKAGEPIGTISQSQNEKDQLPTSRSKGNSELEGQIFALSGTGSSVLVVPVPENVQPEGVVVWARALFGDVSAARTVVFGSIPGSKFLGIVDEGQPPAVYKVETTPQRAGKEGRVTTAAYLPTGNLVDGVAAAVLSHCQARRQAATLLVNIDQTTGPDQRTLQKVADALRDCIGDSVQGLEARWPELVSTSLKELASRARKQSWSELYS